MRRLPLIAAAAAALTLVALSVPALSVRPYVPDPVEFRLDAPEPLVRAARGADVVSPVVRPPKRFNLVGFRWRGDAEPDIAVRTRAAGGEWSPWVRVAAHGDHAPDAGSGEAGGGGGSDPVWTGQADELQYRFSRPVPGVRLHFVNTTGSATPGARVLTSLRRAVSAGIVRLASIGGVAGAQEPRPPIVPRADWGAANCPPRDGPAEGEVRAAYVHHTVSTNDYSPEEAPAIVLAICRYHRNSNGWDDVGYNFLVDKYGTIYEGRAGGVDRAIVGAQAQGYNAQTTGISNIGTHTSVPQSPQALDAMARLIRWKLPLHGVPTDGEATLTSAGGSTNRYPSGRAVTIDRVSGHRDGNRTSCPGDALYAQLPDLRARIGRVGPGAGVVVERTRISVGLDPREVVFPGDTRATGRVRTLRGAPAAEVPVEVQQLGRDGAWRLIARATTGSDGAYAARVAPPGNRTLRARFPGASGLRPSASGRVGLRVLPLIEADRSVTRARAGQTPVVQGTIRPAKSRVMVIVERRDGSALRRVAAEKIRARAGRFRKAFRLTRPGLYRFRVVFEGDSANPRAESSAFHIRVVPGSGGAAP